MHGRRKKRVNNLYIHHLLSITDPEE
jgi:hypothetical protein